MAARPSDGSIRPVDARNAMIACLRSDGVLRSPSVEDALRRVPRHRFVDEANVESAYADIAIPTKTDELGTAISSLSQPTIVAAMLELSQLKTGHRVLEIGAGTGYNAALLSYITGTEGLVVSVELENDLAVAARQRLRSLGFSRVNLVTGDGASGHLASAPYDRIIVTTGAPRIASAWLDQLNEVGRLVVPVVNSDGIGTIRCLVRRGTKLEEEETMPCGFLPMRTS